MDVVVAVAVIGLVVSTLAFLPGARRRDLGRRHAQPAAGPRRAAAPAVPLLVAVLVLWPWVEPTAGLTASALVWLLTLTQLPLSRRWSARAHASWSLGVVSGALYLLAMTRWTLTAGLHGGALVGAWLLLALEAAAYLLFLSYAYELHDALGSRRWTRRGEVILRPAAEAPFVSIHVPAHNEPPDLVISTLERLLVLDHPAYEVLVIDNNTDDDALCAPVEAFCAAHPERLTFHRLLDWPGYKSGALNYALEHVDPRTSLIGVVDADYQVDPEWLTEATAPFADPRVAFVQSPQDYRGWEEAQYLRSLYHSYDYFFAVSQPSRDERDAAIFGGTMGLVRREALVEVGGWDEWCVTEDAELSLRLLAGGWSGRHLDRSYGHGIMPLTFEALKRQRFRWCFGGMQILRRHGRMLLLGGTALTPAQRLGYLFGGVQWFGDLLGIVFSLVVMTSLVDLAFGGGFAVGRLSGLLVVAVPALVALAVLRSAAGVRAASRAVPEHAATWRDAVGAYFIWASLGWVVALASVRGLLEREGVFLRTPKVSEEVRWVDAVRANRVETALVVLAVGVVASALVLRPSPVTVGLSLLLVLPVAGWLAALWHTIAAMRAELPRELSEQRRQERRRGWWRPRAGISLASLAGAAALAVVVAVVVQPGSTDQPATPALPRLQRPPAASPTDSPSATRSATSRPASTPGSTSSTVGGTSPTTRASAPPTATPTAPAPTPTSVTSPSATPTPTPGPTHSSRPTPTSHPTPTRRPTPTPTPTHP